LYLQDQGSQLAAHLAAGPGRLLDACAAPGGKSTLLADAEPRPRLVVAAEASPRRLLTLAALVERWGSPAVRCVAADAGHPPLRARPGPRPPRRSATRPSTPCCSTRPAAASAPSDETRTSAGAPRPATWHARPGGSGGCSRPAPGWSPPAAASSIRPVPRS